MIFADFQCPFCAHFALLVLPTIEWEYVRTGRLQLEFRHLPLDDIHPYARRAGMAAVCAARQGQFWAFHDQMFRLQPLIPRLDYREVVSVTGMDSKTFLQCVESNPTEEIEVDSAVARALNISATPTFAIGEPLLSGQVRITRVLTGFQTVDRIRRALDETAR